jgi:Protein of unknown function (DUF2997)
MSQVIVTINPAGETTVEADGITGSQCSLHTRPYILALGKPIQSKPKAEMFIEETATQQLETVQ